MFRALTRSINPFRTIIKRNIMTSKQNLSKEALEKLQTNPYFDKYAEKIAKLQQTSPEEFLDRVEIKLKQQEQKAKNAIEERAYSSLLRPKKEQTAGDASEESLEKIMKVDLIKDKEAEEIKDIWLKYHIQKEVLAATIPKEEYERMMAQAKKTPTFILPLPRSQGYEFIVLQHYLNTIHFTPLICYQVHKENAPECLTLTNYTEFKDTKGIILMRGEYDKEVLSAKEAQCLVNQMQLYYSQKDAEKLKLMEIFTNRPDEFKHGDLIKQIETLSLS